VLASRNASRAISSSAARVPWKPRGVEPVEIGWDLDRTARAWAALLDLLAELGLAFDAFRTGRQPDTEAHTRQETPQFAKSIERHALLTPNAASA
jgi:hypothetical protein